MDLRRQVRQLVDQSHQARRTAPALRQLVFHIAELTLQEKHGNGYVRHPEDVAIVTHALLQRLGVTSTLGCGYACLPMAAPNPNGRGYHFAGWREARLHMWVFTCFREMVDLTPSQLHLHPPQAVPCAPIRPLWWDDLYAPPIPLWYVPKRGSSMRFTPEDDQDAYQFEPRGMALLDQLLSAPEGEAFQFAQMLDSPRTLLRMAEAGDPWAKVVGECAQRGEPLPAECYRRRAEWGQPA